MMNISNEEENLIRARKVIDDEVQPRLRKYFKQKWNGQKGIVAWSDSGSDGNAVIEKLEKRKRKVAKDTKDKIKSGNTEVWDATCLFEAILALGIGKVASAAIGKLRDQRNFVFHRYRGELSNTERDAHFDEITKAYKELSWPEDDVNDYKTKTIETEEMKKLKAQLESEKRKGRPFNRKQ